MAFDVHDRLLPSAGPPVRITVDYLDRGTGRFALQYDAASDAAKTAFVVTKSNSNAWKTESVVITDWAFANRGPSGADLALVNVDADDDIFHGVEIRRLDAPCGQP